MKLQGEAVPADANIGRCLAFARVVSGAPLRAANTILRAVAVLLMTAACAVCPLALAQSAGGPDSTLAFAPTTMASGATAKLIVTLNAGSGSDVADIAVTSGALVSPLSVVAGSGVTTCPKGGFSYGPNSFHYANTFDDVLPSGHSCTIAVDVTGVIAPTTRLIQQALFITVVSVPCGDDGGDSVDASGLPFGCFAEQVPATSADLTILAGTPPTITSGLPPDGAVGVAYSHQVTVTGSTPIFVSAQGLPPGLSFDTATDKVTGTPTAAGTYAGSFTATNGIKPDALQSFTIVISGGSVNPPPPPPPPPLVITTASPLPVAGIGAVYSTGFNASGGVAPYTWSLAGGSLPPGLTLPANGALSGTPTTAGAFTFDVRVTDSAGAVTNKSFDLTVIGSTLSIVTGTPLAPPLTVGTPFTVAFAATGGAPPYLWALAGGSLPPGLALGTNGVITGAPTTTGSYAFTVQAIDTVNGSAMRAYSLDVVAPPLSIVTPAPLTPPIPAGGAFAIDLEADGGLPPYVWTLASGDLPPGVTLAPNGRLSGAPTKAGSYTFVVAVTDSLGTVANKTYTLVVQLIASTLSATIAPNPATLGAPVILNLLVAGTGATPTGSVQVWIAGTAQRCADPFVTGKPTDAVPAPRTPTLDANGRAQLTLNNLAIDDYLVCARYGGDGLYAAALAGPFGASVIKGVLLPPLVTLLVPAQVPPGATVLAQVSVAPIGTTLVPQGSVHLRSANGVLTGVLSEAVLTAGVAQLSFTAPTEGMLALTAEYAGDAAFPPATSQAVPVVIAAGAAVPTLATPLLGLLALMLAAFALMRLPRRRR